MNNPTHYRLIAHLDKPKRFMSFSIDELLVVMMGLMLLVASNHKFLVGLFSFALLSVLRFFKQGKGPRFLLVQWYWFMPSSLSKVIAANVPASHYRKWRG